MAADRDRVDREDGNGPRVERDGSVRAVLRASSVEIIVALAILVLVGLSAFVVAHQVNQAGVPAECWVAHFSQDASPSPDCERAFAVYWGVQHSAVDAVVLLAVFVPFAVGLLLGVPLVPRLARWSPSDGDRRPLAAAIVVMLVVVMLGLAVVAWLVASMWTTAEPWTSAGPGRTPSLSDLPVAPLSFVARGVLAFGVGLLAGALLRQVIPAYALAVAVLFVVVAVGAQGLHAVVAQGVAVWQERCGPAAGDDCQDGDWLYYLSTGFRDGEGPILTPDEAQALMLERCPTCEPGEDAWVYQNLAEVWRVAPAKSFGTFEAAEAATWSALGGLCILLSFPVLSWQRRRQAAGYPRTTAISTSG
jgi:hypothetical protein